MSGSKTKALMKALLKAADEMKAALALYQKGLEAAVKTGAEFQPKAVLKDFLAGDAPGYDAAKAAFKIDLAALKKQQAAVEAKSAALTTAVKALKDRLVEKKKVKNPFKKLNVAKAQAAVDQFEKANFNLDGLWLSLDLPASDMLRKREHLTKMIDGYTEMRKGANDLFTALDDDE